MKLPTLSWSDAAILVMAVASMGLGVKALPISLVVNTTPSIPLGLYWLDESPVGTLHRQELVAYRHHAPAWARGRYHAEGYRLLKHIGAIPGDRLNLEGREVSACAGAHCWSLGKALVQDSKGRPLPLPAWAQGLDIPAGSYFMSSQDVPNSYDSRYQGLVPEDAIEGRIHPLLTW